MTRQALPVRACDVDAAWPQVLGLIERALAESDGGHSAEDVRDACKAGDAQLWCGFGSDGLELIMVTEIRRRPRLKAMRIWLMAGSDAPEWIAERSAAIEEWAASAGCSRLEMVGRKGWLKRLPGWDRLNVVMSKEIAHGRR